MARKATLKSKVAVSSALEAAADEYTVQATEPERPNRETIISIRRSDSIPRFQDAFGCCTCYEGQIPYKGRLPPPPMLESSHTEERQQKQGEDGIDRAMKIIDKYYEGVPLKNMLMEYVDEG